MSCPTGKVGYPSPELAENAMYHSQSVAKDGDYMPIRYYLCDHCKRYHLTSQEKRESSNLIEDFISLIMRLSNGRISSKNK